MAPDLLKRLVISLADKIGDAPSAYVGIKSMLNGLGETQINLDRPPTGPRDRSLCAMARFLDPFTSESLRLIRGVGYSHGGYVMAYGFVGLTGVDSIGIG